MKKYLFLLLFPFSLFAQNTPLVRVDSYAALRALAIPTVNNRLAAIVSGYAGPVAEGGGLFIYDSASAVADDDDLYVKPTATTGRWIKVVATGVGGSGLTSLNGLTGGTQTFAVGTSGTNFTIVSSGTAHTFNIPVASGSNTGLLSAADYTTLFAGIAPTNVVTATSAFDVDNSLLRSDGTNRLAQASPIIVSDIGEVSGVNSITVTNAVNAGSVNTTGTNTLIRLGDADNSHAVTLKPPTSVTSNYNWVYPPAGFTGLAQMTLSGSDLNISQITGGVGLIGLDASNLIVHINSIAELETATASNLVEESELVDVENDSFDVTWSGNLNATTKGSLWTAFGTSATPTFASLSIATLNLTGTGTINGLDAIDATTETTLENTLDFQPVATLLTRLSAAPQTLTSGSSVATDASLGCVFRLTAGHNFTLSNPTNPVDGQRIEWEILQDGTGGRTIAFDTKFAFGDTIPSITLTTTAGKRDFFTARYNSTSDKWYVVGVVTNY